MLARSVATILFASIILVGCNITVIPTDPFPDAIPASATANPLVPSASGTLVGQSSVVYEVDLTGAAASDLIYLELDQDLDLIVYRSNGGAYASSASSDAFASGLSGLAANLDMTPQAIGTNVICRGSCVITNSLGNLAFVKIENPNASPKNYSLFVFGDSYADTTEPANDAPSTAPTVTTSVDGAIETLGDIDYYVIPSDGSLTLDTATTALAIRATIVGTSIVIQDGQATNVLAGDVMRVEVAGGSQAAAAGASRYTLTFTVGSNFPGSTPISATADPFIAAASGTLAGQGSVVYEVNVSSTTSSDLVYLELDQDLELTVYRSDGSVFASSHSADGFAAGLSGLGLTTQAISVEVFCRGSCVIANATADSVYVRVENPGASPTSFSLFAYGDAYADTNEPANDTAAGARLVTTSGGGAIETLGDVDYFEMGLDGTVTFTTDPALDIRATIDAVPIELTNGQSYTAVPGDIVRVEVVGGSRAGASAVSGYSLTYLN